MATRPRGLSVGRGRARARAVGFAEFGEEEIKTKKKNRLTSSVPFRVGRDDRPNTRPSRNDCVDRPAGRSIGFVVRDSGGGGGGGGGGGSGPDKKKNVASADQLYARLRRASQDRHARHRRRRVATRAGDDRPAAESGTDATDAVAGACTEATRGRDCARSRRAKQPYGRPAKQPYGQRSKQPCGLRSKPPCGWRAQHPYGRRMANVARWPSVVARRVESLAGDYGSGCATVTNDRRSGKSGDRPLSARVAVRLDVVAFHRAVSPADFADIDRRRRRR